jgi:outer membrane protein assembly factor BamB
LKRQTLALLGLFAAFLLSACGALPAASWPGVATNGTLAYIANNHQIIAVDLSNGKQVGAFPPTANTSFDQFSADPGISSDVLVVGSQGPAGASSGALFGLDPDPARMAMPKWCLAFDTRAAERLASYNCQLTSDATRPIVLTLSEAVDSRIIGGIALVDGVAYFGVSSNNVYAVDAATGKEKWIFKGAEHPVWATPLIDQDSVYVASLDHSIYALDRRTGSLRWSKDLGASLGGTPALLEGTLYVGTFGNTLHALDAATGQERWGKPFEAKNWIWGGPALQDGTLYFADLNGNVFAVDAQSGAQKWMQTPGGKMRGSPAIAGDRLIIGDKDGNVFALRLSDGSPAWKQTVKGQLYASPVIVPEREMVLIAVYQGDNLLMAYKTTDGSPPGWSAFAPSQ